MPKITSHPQHAQAHAQEVSERDLLEAADVDQIRKENAELRARLEEMEQCWLDSQREFENLLEEKSEVIRGLHQKIQELQDAGSLSKSTAVQPDELLELQKQMETERAQLREDEETLMVQMRQMELTMSKERADLARQRTELQRQQADLNREVELASRDGGLRERLGSLQRRQDSDSRQVEPARAAPSVKTPAPSENTPLPKKSNSSLIRRLFG